MLTMIRSLLLVAGLALGLSTQAAATAAEPTCSEFLNVSIADPGSPSPVELRQVLTVVRTAIAEQHVKNADAFPAQNGGVFGMMKGGGLKTVGYSKDGHANQPITFMDCLDACYDDCRCLGFHWSGKHARCGLKADGNVPVLADNRYQKTFRSFKRLVAKSCIPATTTPEPTTTTPEPTTTTPEPTTTTTSATTTTTQEPTTTTPIPYSTMNTTQCEEAFDGELTEYFRDHSDCEDCLNAATAELSPWPQLPQCVATLPTLRDLAAIALSNDTAGYNDPVPSTGENCENDDGCWLCDGVHFGCHSTASFELGMWNTSAITSFKNAFRGMNEFNQNINGFVTSAVTTMYGMFAGAAAFNQNIAGFNTSAVKVMMYMFKNAAAFNQNINGFDTSAVTNNLGMAYMFQYAAAFNQNINGWDTGAVKTMESMFQFAVAFNQNINGWDTSAVKYMSNMFQEATLMNENPTKKPA